MAKIKSLTGGPPGSKRWVRGFSIRARERGRGEIKEMAQRA